MRQSEGMMNPEQCWQAVERRDRGRDGDFYFGVVTTGVYCRPSCPARRPLRKNVRFYRTPQEAERDGLRPCRRCRPLEAPGAKMHDLCRYIEASLENPPDLAALAARAGMSRFHVQRSFKTVVGLTPREYAEACRVRKLRTELRRAKDVTEAVYGAGFGSGSGAYKSAAARFGMTPGQYRRGAPGLAIAYTTTGTPFGPLMIAATERGLCFVQFGESAGELLAALRHEYPAARIGPAGDPAPPGFDRYVKALRRHLAGARPSLDLPLDIRATAFQARVWNYLRSIPAGEVRSYTEVAAAIGAPSAVRAVARACASNTVALAIPCHRVIRRGGGLGGYRWGLERKRALLDAERTQPGRHP